MSPCSFWRKLLRFGSRKFAFHLLVAGTLPSSRTLVKS